jgi:YD repeat-containing protein
MVKLRTSPFLTACSVAWLWVFTAHPVWATPITCQGVGVAAPGDSSVQNIAAQTSILNVYDQGEPCGVIVPNGVLSLSGTLSPGADLGSPSGTTMYTYDTLGFLLSDTSTEGPTSFLYDSPDRLVQNTEGTFTTSYQYDSLGRLSETTTSQGASIVNDVTYQYDSLNRLASEMAGSTTFTFTYDSDGLIDQQAGGTFTTTYVYDSLGRLKEIDTTIGSTTYKTIYTYDSGGFLRTGTDPNNGHSSYTYDSSGRLVSNIDPNGATTTYIYDSSGRLSSSTNTSGNTRYVYAATPIPEPGTLILTGFGLAGLIRAGSRRLRRST